MAWADDISETDVARGLIAGGVSIYSGNPAPFYSWLDRLINRTVVSLSVNLESDIRRRAVKIAKQSLL